MSSASLSDLECISDEIVYGGLNILNSKAVFKDAEWPHMGSVLFLWSQETCRYLDQCVLSPSQTANELEDKNSMAAPTFWA
ncbi:hypothetical protein OPT61_g1717 [Boeremia exigua]|uniref:Uncharacterized protein n=1 Tax=Boeremia exigua TaxID=749465 RepID=A0ACC2IPB7_9PLEO|nr:hypothetical protein OPT61_g1717 [Boeremia exigua]